METEKKQVFENKYDRQIRLWGVNGQQRLTNSNILLLNCEPSGVETFKNLVLPGIGSIAVADDKNVQQSDLHKNFFVTQEDLAANKSRAQAVFENFCEMNPDCKGKYVNKKLSELVNDNGFLKEYNLIVASELFDDLLTPLSKACSELNIILIIVNTYGYVGKIRVQNGCHTVIETKPLQATFFDLRISQPFKQLQDLADSYDLDSINNRIQKGVEDGDSGKAIHELQHIPYAIILIKALAKYRQQFNGQTPKTFKEKQEFKKLLKAMGEKVPLAGNFEQAVSYSHYALTAVDQIHANINGGVKAAFKHPLLENSKETFWVLVRALKKYYDSEGCLPLSYNIPDMESTTQNFLKIKKIYKEKFEEDVTKYTTFLEQKDIPEADVRLFIQNICYLGVFDYRPYHEELQKPLPIEIPVDYDNEGNQIINYSFQWIIALKGLNQWVVKNGGKYPEYQKDEDSLYQEVENARKTYEISKEGEQYDQPIDKKVVQELVRVDNIKLNNIASILGGIASQEAVKLITHQFQPLNNTFIYDGIYSTSANFVL